MANSPQFRANPNLREITSNTLHSYASGTQANANIPLEEMVRRAVEGVTIIPPVPSRSSMPNHQTKTPLRRTMRKLNRIRIAIMCIVFLLLVSGVYKSLPHNNSQVQTTTYTTPSSSQGSSNNNGGYYQYSINQANAIVEGDAKYKKDGTALHPSTFDAIGMIKKKDTSDAYSLFDGTLTWMAQAEDVKQACIMLVNGSGNVMDTHTQPRYLNQAFYNFKKNSAGWYIDSFFLMNGYQDNCPAGGSPAVDNPNPIPTPTVDVPTPLPTPYAFDDQNGYDSAGHSVNWSSYYEDQTGHAVIQYVKARLWKVDDKTYNECASSFYYRAVVNGLWSDNNEDTRLFVIKWTNYQTWNNSTELGWVFTSMSRSIASC